MSEKKKIVVVISHGHSHEKGVLGLTIACGGLTDGMDVNLFLTSDGVDMAREGSLDNISVDPYERHKMLLEDFMMRGGKVAACKLCSGLRGYTNTELMGGIEIQGASYVFKLVKDGASIWNF